MSSSSSSCLVHLTKLSAVDAAVLVDEVFTHRREREVNNLQDVNTIKQLMTNKELERLKYWTAQLGKDEDTVIEVESSEYEGRR